METPVATRESDGVIDTTAVALTGCRFLAGLLQVRMMGELQIGLGL